MYVIIISLLLVYIIISMIIISLHIDIHMYVYCHTYQHVKHPHLSSSASRVAEEPCIVYTPKTPLPRCRIMSASASRSSCNRRDPRARADKMRRFPCGGGSGGLSGDALAVEMITGPVAGGAAGGGAGAVEGGGGGRKACSISLTSTAARSVM